MEDLDGRGLFWDMGSSRKPYPLPSIACWTMNEMNLKAKALKINTDVGIIPFLCKWQGRFTLGVFCITLFFMSPGRSTQAITGMDCSWHLSGDVLCPYSSTPEPYSLPLLQRLPWSTAGCAGQRQVQPQAVPQDSSLAFIHFEPQHRRIRTHQWHSLWD